MTREVIAVDENVSMMKASKMMKEKGVQHLPVIRQGRLTGEVATLRAMATHLKRVETCDIVEEMRTGR